MVRDVEKTDDRENVEAPFVVGFDERADQEGDDKDEANCPIRQRDEYDAGKEKGNVQKMTVVRSPNGNPVASNNVNNNKGTVMLQSM